MSWATATTTVSFALAVLLTGCTGPLMLRGLHSSDRGRDAPRDEATANEVAVSRDDATTAPSAAPVVTPHAALPPLAGLDAQTDARVRDALWKLQRENPQGCEALKRLLYEQDPSIPPLMAQGLREQCVAHLLAYSTGFPPSESPHRPGPTAPPATTSPTNYPTSSPTNSPTTSSTTTPATSSAATPAPASTLDGALAAIASPSKSSTAPAATADKTQAPPSPAPPTSSAAPTEGAAAESPSNAPAVTTASATTSTASPTEDKTPPQPELATEVKPGEWAAQVRQAITELEQELARAKHDEAESARLNALLRLLYVVANRREQAVTPIEGLTEDEREFWKQQLYGLTVSLDTDGMHTPNRRATLALRYYDTAQNHLANMSTLDVRGLAFCAKVESFGRFEEFKTNDFRPGQEVLLYVEVDHFAVETKGDQFETELQGEYEVFDQQGVRVTHAVLPLDKQLCNNRRRDYFIAYRLFIPKDLAAGKYTLRLTIEDLKGKKSNQSSIDFKVRG